MHIDSHIRVCYVFLYSNAFMFVSIHVGMFACISVYVITGSSRVLFSLVIYSDEFNIELICASCCAVM